ncbi:MAG: hypothetical protein OYH77_03215 [Pseudomonadota bacterium]|nr:hypothetical protein [Pseudomonadota bacterium]
MSRTVRYEPEDNPPYKLAISLGFQYAILAVAGIVLTPVIIISASGMEGQDSYILWAAFAALIVSGITTILQAVGKKRIGAGYILLMGTSATFIAISINALAKGGVPLLTTLIMMSALVQFLLSWRLSLFRRVFNSTVGGTIIMLIAVSIMPHLFPMLERIPADSSNVAGLIAALATVLTVIIIIFKSNGIMRLWSPVIGIGVGCAVSAVVGIYDLSKVAAAPWISIPLGHWPGLSFDFSPSFWILLPSFLFVTIIGAIETVGDAIAIQQVSRRKPRSIDFRSIQGAVSTDGVGNLLSGLMATIPNTTYSSSVFLVELTGVAAKRVGICVGAALIGLAFFPKFIALILSIPQPVVAAYMVVSVAMLFIVGIKLVIRHSNYQQCMIAAIGFWLGYAFQAKLVFPSMMQSSPVINTLLSDGMTSGGLVALALSGLMEVLSSRRKSIRTVLNDKALESIHPFLRAFAASRKWDEKATVRLCAAAEETVLSVLSNKKDTATATSADEVDEEVEEVGKERQLLINVRGDKNAIEIECLATLGDDNLEDKMVVLQSHGDDVSPDSLSMRILRKVSSHFRHQKFHNTDIVTVRVDALPHQH